VSAKIAGIEAIRDKALEFNVRLHALKHESAPHEAWYPYDTLSNFIHLDRVLTGSNRSLFDDIAGASVADIGAADGDSAFFLESLGADHVDIIDNPSTNYNGCRGMAIVRDALASKAQIAHVDLDEQFRLPRDRYSLVLLLGILYHLKNPFYVLEKLAKISKYCLLSTRVTRYANDGVTELKGIPVAYLVNPDEANGDATNFWVFSDAGLRRIISRTGWDVADYATFGNLERSDPATSEGDERAFALLTSRYIT